MISTGGGRFDRPGKIVFNATFTYLTDQVKPNAYLYSFWEMDSPKDYEYFQLGIDRGDRILIDSGAHGIYQSMIRRGLVSYRDRAIDADTPDMQRYFDRYCDFLSEYEPFLWGYVELDLGTEAQKTAIRSRMEALNLYPIPVFHPTFDSLEYLDFLCQSYDRICFGNIATEPESVRMLVIQLASEAKRRYPHLWVHLLGIAPSFYLAAFPNIDSIDSSTSSSLIRFGRFSEGMCFDARFRVTDDFCNRLADRESYRLGSAVGYRSYLFHSLSWNQYWKEIHG